MRIAIISDQHLGFGQGTEREQDAFLQARQAFEIAVGKRVDFVLLAGDFFDESVPRQEQWYNAFELLGIPARAKSSGVKAKKGASKVFFGGIPIIAIHGTHEYRARHYKNALHVLESAGFLVHLHGERAFVEKGGERVCVFGVSGVPEKKALDVFRALEPVPEQGCFNIFVMHQGLKEYLPFGDEMTATLSLADLPKEFDLVVNGHLHWREEKNMGSCTFLMPGSTIATQSKKAESGKPKGLVVYDTCTRVAEFVAIPEQRTVFYEKLSFKNAEPKQVLEGVSKAIEGFLGGTHALNPVVRVKCTGTLAKGFGASDICFAELESRYSSKAILSLDKVFEAVSFKKSIAELREIQKGRKSVAELGLELLEKKLLETSFGKEFDARQLFELLAEGELEKAEKLLKQGAGK